MFTDGLTDVSYNYWSWLPGLSRNWAEVPTWTLGFGLVFLASLAVYYYALRLSWHQAGLLASCTMSSVHAIGCLTFGYSEIQGWDEWRLDLKNEPAQTSMLQFSSAYMLSDSLFYVLLFTPSDVMFIVHHAISLLYVVGVIQSGHGAISAVVMYFLGEVTSPLLNGLTFAETLHTGLRSRKAQVVHRYLSTLFTAAFILIRTFVGLPTIAWFLYSLVWRSPAIHAGWRALMGVCVAIGMLGSQAWTVKLMAGLFRQWHLHIALRAKAA